MSHSFRLARKRDFQFVFDHPHKVRGQCFYAFYRPNTLNLPRLGMMFKKHHVRRAVDRNLLKRIVRESFRHHQDTLVGLDIIVFKQPGRTSLNKRALRSDSDSLWQIITKST